MNLTALNTELAHLATLRSEMEALQQQAHILAARAEVCAANVNRLALEVQAETEVAMQRMKSWN